jgi:transposase InsO family protein
LSWLDALERWWSKNKRRLLLEDAAYDKILDVLVRGDISHKRYKEWSSKYVHKTLPPSQHPQLYTIGDAVQKRKPSGRNNEPQKTIGVMEHLAAASPTVDTNNQEEEPDQEMDGVSDVAASAAAAAVPVQTRHVPIIGTQYPAPHPVYKRVLKISEVTGILKRVHDEQGHMGIDSTFAKLSRYFHGISRDLVIGYIKRCAKCSERAKPAQIKPPIFTPIRNSGRYLDHTQADCFFFLDKRGIHQEVRIVLHFICLATKMSEFVHIENKSSATMRLAFWRIFMKTGPPTVLQTDNGTEFIDQACQELFRSLNIQYRNGMPYKPSSQGCVERYNFVCKFLLTEMCSDEYYFNWEFKDILAQCQYWMNTFERRTTKMSPYYLVNGRLPPLIMQRTTVPDIESMHTTYDRELEKANKKEVDYDSEDEPLEEQKDSDHPNREEAAAANHTRYQNQWMAQQGDRLVSDIFKVGDIVLFTPISKKKHKAISKQVDKQYVLVVKVAPYGKFMIYTRHGLLKDSIPSNYLEHPVMDATLPNELQLNELMIQEVLKGKGMTIDSFIEKVLEIETELVGPAREEIKRPKEGETEPQIVIRIPKQRKRKVPPQ